MRLAWIVVLCACAPRAGVPEVPADIRWRLEQREEEGLRIGDALLRPGSMIYLAPEPGRIDVLAIDPLPSHFEAGQTVNVRVMIRPIAEAERYHVQAVDRSPHLQIEPSSFELGRGQTTRIRLTSSIPGSAHLRLEAIPKGGVQ